MLEVGSLVDGKYKILSKVGQGGMSVVWMAINEKANKTWAVKEVRKDGVLEFEAVKQGLVAETDILKKLNHKNLPSIIDVIDNEDSFIIIMDYIEGNSLNKALEEYGAQPQEYVIEWAKQLCDVLGYLHSRQPAIIYRDMKPANIMLKPDGNVTLIDFGTAREFKEKNLADTTCLGTVGYAAPEQFGGMGQTDARTDIYCLGATLFHLVTGCNPSEPPYEMKPIRQINPELSSGLERIILKCTQRNPDDRYQSAAELMYALDHYKVIDDEYKKKQKIKLSGFIAALSLSVIFAVSGLSFNIVAHKKASEEYQRVLQNAEDTFNYNEKIKLYQDCIAIPNQGGNKEAYLGLIRAFRDNDHNFTDSEANTLDKLISNNRDELIKNPKDYADICYETGKLYWYYYQENANKLTSAINAKNWFGKVKEYAPDGYENRGTAEVYYAVGDFYSTITELQKTGEDRGIYQDFFNNLSLLMESVGKNDNETEIVRLEMLELARSSIQQYATKFKRDGVEKQDIDAMLSDIESIASKMETDLTLKNNILNLLNDTKLSVAIDYGTGNGGN